jgi:galactokinase
VISENDRTFEAVEVLKAGDLIRFGQLMNASHDSLRDDYDVTGIELDTLVAESRKIPGVIGSRMTGAGFGGCTVSLVKDESIDQMIKEVGEKYLAKTGLKADFYVAEVGDGAKKM